MIFEIASVDKEVCSACTESATHSEMPQDNVTLKRSLLLKILIEEVALFLTSGRSLDIEFRQPCLVNPTQSNTGRRLWLPCSSLCCGRHTSDLVD